jgi:hypothetical protein
MTSVVQPVTFYVPASAGEPVEVKVAHSGLRMVLVNRESVRLLGNEWRALGIYFLLGPAENDPDRFRAYVGEVGRRELLTRLTEHVAQKPWWSRALLVAGEAKDGFNSAEIGWLDQVDRQAYQGVRCVPVVQLEGRWPHRSASARRARISPTLSIEWRTAMSASA